ncbi:exopolysaccharide phosphotransferase [Actinoplanes sp. OR16]|uniref:stealth family protein n=1 Tax=Actinoplanes sp. OR16 TaxID=946334 RepID=UPI000F6D5212|nr:stealth family protein [Actinoplanes sp. OR16]BBH65607.1 exopolysaccharide phosphotransferase [Actinoplanes sp. OR16]
MIALRFYRLLPKDYRLKLIELLPPNRQLWLVRRLTRQRSLPKPAQTGSMVTVRDAGESVRARVVPDMTPAAAWKQNLDAVVAVLERAGIDYFCLRPVDTQHSAVAVNSRDRERTLAALRADGRLTGAEVRIGRINDEGFTAGRGKTGVQVYFPITSPYGTTVFGSGSACEIEFWRTERGPGGAPDIIVAPRRNSVATALPAEPHYRQVPPVALNPILSLTDDRPQYRTRSEFAVVPAEDVRFPIDVVYTWVDGSDPDWVDRKNASLAAFGREQTNTIAANASRFISRDELKYSLRSIAAYAPWVRKIFLVTDDQVPPWLDTSDPRLTVVSHREVFGDTGVLPTFNSHAIESRLHRIPGLAEHFIYFNDDMFLGRPVSPEAFFHANGIAKYFPSKAQLEAGPATVFDAPVTAAGKNNRRHIAERFDRGITQKMQHVPYPLQKSVLEEIESWLPDEVRQTAEHPFRHPGDLSIPSSLQHYWAFLTKRAVPGSISYTYADLAHPSTPVQLAFLLARRRSDVFCLNDTNSAAVALSQQAEMLADFLPLYFPFRSPYELPDDVAAERAQFSATQLARAAASGPIQIPRQPTAAAPIPGMSK